MSFEEIVRIHQRMNRLAESLIGRPAFEPMHILLPDPTSPEAGFIRATSWLYCLYFEAGRTSITFLRRLGEAYDQLDRDASDRHVETVRALRTESHHNLGFGPSDQAARRIAERWRKKACGTALPRSPTDWESCYTCIVIDAKTFLLEIDDVVRRIEIDATDGQSHVEDWRRRLERTLPAAAFDPFIERVKYQLALGALDTVAFRNRHADRWRGYIDSLDDGYDFDFEATRLIESTMLNEASGMLPITGTDLIESLGVKPGPVVGTLLEEARRVFEVKRCGKRELLEHLCKFET